MNFPSKEILEQLRRRYPEDTRIELIRMDDPYNKKLGPGSKGTVRFVDAAGLGLRFFAGVDPRRG